MPGKPVGLVGPVYLPKSTVKNQGRRVVVDTTQHHMRQLFYILQAGTGAPEGEADRVGTMRRDSPALPNINHICCL